jgi:hypothetical protein
MYGRCGTGQIVYLVDFDVERKRYIVPHQLEPRVSQQVLDIALASGKHVVDAKNIVALLDQAITQMTSNEPGSPGD